MVRLSDAPNVTNGVTKGVTPQGLLNAAITELATKIGGDAVFPFMKLVEDYANHVAMLRTKELNEKLEEAALELKASTLDRTVLLSKLLEWTSVFGDYATPKELGLIRDNKRIECAKLKVALQHVMEDYVRFKLLGSYADKRSEESYAEAKDQLSKAS